MNNIDATIAGAIAGTTDYRNVQPLERPATAAELAFAIDVGLEIGARYGIDTAAHVAAQHAREKEHELKLRLMTL